jgi:hypothetical protein
MVVSSIGRAALPFHADGLALGRLSFCESSIDIKYHLCMLTIFHYFMQAPIGAMKGRLRELKDVSRNSYQLNDSETPKVQVQGSWIARLELRTRTCPM